MELKDDLYSIYDIKTKAGDSPRGKQKVYFCCHPIDFNKYYDKIAKDLFKFCDCAVYSKKNPEKEINDPNFFTDLKAMNLIVVPVTFKLLTEYSPAMNVEIKYAIENHKIVLPFMMEPSIDEIYAKNVSFGRKQYLKPFSTDNTEQSYETKLKNFLEKAILSNRVIESIKKEFDGQVFLSYRKKDRYLANELMLQIHSDPRFRDIAIWFDEFLTPGENFEKNIKKALRESDLFTILVTPNLVIEPNYVQEKEYPWALKNKRKNNVEILPLEKIGTNKEELDFQFPGIGTCVNANENNILSDALVKALPENVFKNDNDPEHLFLIGLAYLNGINVELNTNQGIKMIYESATHNYVPAINELIDIYYSGVYCKRNYDEVLKWKKRKYTLYYLKYGKEHIKTLKALNNIACTLEEKGEYSTALKTQEEVYDSQKKVFGEKHPDTVKTLSNLACMYKEVGDSKQALKLSEDTYYLSRKVFGKKHPDTLTIMNNLAYAYTEMEEKEKALKLHEKVYTLKKEVLGAKHPDTLVSLGNLAYVYGIIGNNERAVQLKTEVYDMMREVFGEKDPNTLIALNNLGHSYGEIGNNKKALELKTKAFEEIREVMGIKHPLSLTILSDLAYAYGKDDNKEKELETYNEVYILRKDVLGEKSPATIKAMSNVAATYEEMGKPEEALELYDKIYTLSKEVLGKNNSLTFMVTSKLAEIYWEKENTKRAIELQDEAYSLSNGLFGEKHTNTLKAFDRLVYMLYGQLKPKKDT